MSAKQVYFALVGSIALLGILFIGGTVVGLQLLQKQSVKLVEQKLESATLDQQQTALVKAKKDLVTYAELGTLAKSIVPQDKDQAKTAREILNIGAKTGVPLTTISFPSSTLGSAIPKAVAKTPETSGSTAAPVNTAPPVTQVKPVEGIKGLYQMEVTVQSDPKSPVRYDNLQHFLAELEKNRRTAQISQLVITPDANNINLLTFTLTLSVFLKP